MGDAMNEPEGPDFVKCAVISCPNCYFPNAKNDLHFFDFPTDHKNIERWTQKCGVAADFTDLQTTDNIKICSMHFGPKDYTTNKRNRLRTDAVPRENLDWMFGVPEVIVLKSAQASSPQKADTLFKVPQNAAPVKRPSLSEPPAKKGRANLEDIKAAVELNATLKQQWAQIQAEQKTLKSTLDVYLKKNAKTLEEIEKIEEQIKKVPYMKRKVGLTSDDLATKVFSPAQITALLGKKRVVWSSDDMALAFTLRHMGNREVYLYLRDTLNLPLPSLASLQRWFAATNVK